MTAIATILTETLMFTLLKRMFNKPRMSNVIFCQNINNDFWSLSTWSVNKYEIHNIMDRITSLYFTPTIAIGNL